MRNARIRLAALWLSQTARTLADNCLRMFVVLEIAAAGQKESEAAWYQTNTFVILPFILLAPVNGALSNGLPKRWVLAGSAAYCLGATALLGLLLGTAGEPWLWCAGISLVMLGSAVYSPTRYALLPAVAQDTYLSLQWVNGWIELGNAAAILLGTLLGIYLHDLAPLGRLPAAVTAIAGLSLLAALAALPARFPADVWRPEPARQAVAGFFRDTGRILQDAEARGRLIGLVGFLALMLTGSGAVLAYSGGLQFAGERGTLLQALIPVSIGAAIGSLLAGMQGHPRRALGLVPLGATGLLIALAWAALSDRSSLTWPCLALGLTGGLVNVPLRAAYQDAVPADARGNGMAVLNTIYYLAACAMAVLLFGLVHWRVLSAEGQLGFLALLAAVGAAAAWYVYCRDSVELLLEILVWPFYRIRDHGPGADRVPRRGPLLVVGNHAAWIDPFMVAKVIPRRLFPLMTSGFYDLPIVHWLMVHLAHAIRVPDVFYRRQAPELQDAIARLDEGETVLIFPEGRLRRREDRLLRQFGQGVWHILRQRPATPVVVCWIEGNWGSLFSFKGGPPLKNKRMDFWRPIDIAISEPMVLDPALLTDLRTTRTYLMKVCLDMRRTLGLEPPAKDKIIDEESVLTSEENGAATSE